MTLQYWCNTMLFILYNLWLNKYVYLTVEYFTFNSTLYQYIKYYNNLNFDYSILFHTIQFYSILFYLSSLHKASIAAGSIRLVIRRMWVRSPPWSPRPLLFCFSIGKTSGNFRITSGNIKKPLENLRKFPKMAENYGNANVFTRPTNRKHFLLHGQFGLAASDFM
jgi:hypothetical protein